MDKLCLLPTFTALSDLSDLAGLLPQLALLKQQVNLSQETISKNTKTIIKNPESLVVTKATDTKSISLTNTGNIAISKPIVKNPLMNNVINPFETSEKVNETTIAKIDEARKKRESLQIENDKKRKISLCVDLEKQKSIIDKKEDELKKTKESLEFVEVKIEQTRKRKESEDVFGIDQQEQQRKRKITNESLTNVIASNTIESTQSTPPPPQIDFKTDPVFTEETWIDFRNTSGDYSKQKAVNQIQLNVFNSYCDQYFKSITEDDLNWLEKKDTDTSAFKKTPLGTHYLDQWSQQDQFNSPFLQQPPQKQSSSNTLLYEDDDNITYPGEVYFGSLSERILASLLEDCDQFHIVAGGEDDDFLAGDQEVSKKRKKGKGGDVERSGDDMAAFEERCRKELIFLGIIDDSMVIDDDNGQDDEISLELKQKQEELLILSERNQKRKQIVLKKVRNWMACQEFNRFLDEKDKAVELAYTRRHKAIKKQKKKIVGTTRPINELVLNVIDERKRLLQELGNMFDTKNFIMPKTSIFQDIDK